MSRVLFTCTGGEIVLPDAVLVSREDGGNLIVNPPREVWERSELTPGELTRWSFLVAAAGKAMLDSLPVLDRGCINYWEAGNWALNEDAAPRGPKTPREHRRVHLHLLGRSRTARHPSWQWGEAPRFPMYSERAAWSAGFERLTAEECRAIVTRIEELLIDPYGLTGITRSAPCSACGYPTPRQQDGDKHLCRECA